MPRNEGMENFTRGFLQGYGSEQDRQRQILQDQLEQAARERQLAISLAQAGVTDPAVFESLRPPASPAPPPGTPGATAVDIAGRVGSHLPGALGKLLGRFKAPGATTEPQITGQEFQTVASAVEKAKDHGRARELKDSILQAGLARILSEDTTKEDALARLMGQQPEGQEAKIARLIATVNALGEDAQATTAPTVAPATPPAPQARPQAAPPAQGAPAGFEEGFPDATARAAQALGLNVPSQSEIEGEGIALRSSRLAEKVKAARFRVEAGQATPEDVVLIRSQDAGYQFPDERTQAALDKVQKQIEAHINTAATKMGKLNATQADFSNARSKLQEARRLAISHGIEPPAFGLGDPGLIVGGQGFISPILRQLGIGGEAIRPELAPGESTTADVDGIVRLFDLESVKGKTNLVKRLKHLVAREYIAPDEAAQVLTQRAGLDATAPEVVAFSRDAAKKAGIQNAIVKRTPGAAKEATGATQDQEALKAQVTAEAARLKGSGMKDAEIDKALLGMGYGKDAQGNITFTPRN